MAFHRDHVKRFVAALNFTPADGEAIKQRAEAAITEFSSKDEGMFSGGKLSEVLGNPDLVSTFDQMWEKGQLHL